MRITFRHHHRHDVEGALRVLLGQIVLLLERILVAVTRPPTAKPPHIEFKIGPVSNRNL